MTADLVARRRASADRVLDLARAHLLAAALDDVVLAGDEVQVAVGVGAEEVARCRAPSRPGSGRARRRSAVSSGLLPVAAHHVAAADHQLAGRCRRAAAGPSSSTSQTSWFGIPRPTLVGPDVELLGRQVGDALALGQPVHREQRGLREQGPQPPDVRLGQRRGRVGDDAQRARGRRPHRLGEVHEHARTWSARRGRR